jgi:serine O-acetyltransferase
VVVSAGAKVLGGFTVGDGAKIGSNAVVIKPVPAGATAVGIPARIIQSQTGESADVVQAKPTFSAYGITQDDDPVSQTLRGLIDYTVEQDKQIAMLWQALEKLAGEGTRSADVVPKEAAKDAHLEIGKLNKLIE